MTGIDIVPEFSTHASPAPGPEFRRILSPSGMLVVGFFDSNDGVAAFDHKVVPAYRWPADVFAEHLARASFTEVQRLQHTGVERPDRCYAAIAARAT